MISYFHRHKFSHVKFVLLLVIVLNTAIPEPKRLYELNFERDLSFCPSCFSHQREPCYRFFAQLQNDKRDHLQNIISKFLPFGGKRQRQVVRLKRDHETRIIAKYLGKDVDFVQLRTQQSVNELRRLFGDPERLDGLQYCPTRTLQRFTNLLERQLNVGRQYQHSPLSSLFVVWLHLVVDVQPLILPELSRFDFPVPQTYASCGFTLFQAHAGYALVHYYDSDFELRLRIAKQLLEAALRFSHGLHGFRLYITDLNADNVVYDATCHQLSIVDLDTLYVVDSATAANAQTHRHVYIECDNCFAYAPQDLCAHRLSDINLFAACQLLREDLRRNRSKGFLHSVPAAIGHAHPQLRQLLNECVDCAGAQCADRFAATLRLIALFDKILGEFYRIF